MKAMGDDKLKVIAAELIQQVKTSVSIDWTLREGARAKIGSLTAAVRSACGLCFAQPVSVALLLRLAGLAGTAVKTVLQQAELLCAEWV